MEHPDVPEFPLSAGCKQMVYSGLTEQEYFITDKKTDFIPVSTNNKWVEFKKSFLPVTTGTELKSVFNLLYSHCSVKPGYSYHVPVLFLFPNYGVIWFISKLFICQVVVFIFKIPVNSQLDIGRLRFEKQTCHITDNQYN